ncbi:Lactonase, 7-bladed beta-propeller-domain-containing protein [Xylaria bambusicola]|uniref:Lactonase, 7-bladed beta-propeller-domain-containing protein n=1 Tax=Xylaria bambusicola TaxID=326684 RepID=UPI0020079093|nr:Lactonase, 7-bladed beta-propeller-domain-containing protein [Xylaria bambusicola]KAI0520821.1 Lactonase, 7-bladed beta-propeller-domain-containing protein [Xylaria bambusicola]
MWKNVLFPATAAGLLAGSTSATLLYVTSYAGTVTTLDLVEGATTKLDTVASTTACGANPSWLALDYSKSFLYCLDEAWGQPTGTVTSFYTYANGTLVPLAAADVIAGPVSIAEFGVGGHGLAIASYAGSGVNVVSMTPEGGVELVQNETYTLEQPGAVPDRQDVPHPHQAILDPTARFVLVPDLGADLVRVYQADASSLKLTAITPLEVPPGAGPRHGAFKTAYNKTYFYLATELSNTIIGYEVVYNKNRTLGFSELFTIPLHGDDREIANTTGAAETLVTPDGKFFIVSSRWERSLSIPNFDPRNSTEIASDPLIVYAIDNKTGLLDKIQEFPAGGVGPRHFSINGDGNRIAVGLQGDGRVAIIERDVHTGLLKDFVATADVEGEVNTVIFYEDYHAKWGKGRPRV